jgi:hypothetical protein
MDGILEFCVVLSSSVENCEAGASLRMNVVRGRIDVSGNSISTLGKEKITLAILSGIFEIMKSPTVLLSYFLNIFQGKIGFAIHFTHQLNLFVILNLLPTTRDCIKHILKFISESCSLYKCLLVTTLYNTFMKLVLTIHLIRIASITI